jgi:ATP-dependent DNA helicase RecQ
MMRAYAELRECRWRYIMNYFGEEPEWNQCGRCDTDQSKPSPHPWIQPSPRGRGDLFEVNDWVAHVSLGEGVVQRVTSDSVTVLFEDSGYKTFDLAMIVEQGLVRRL